MTLRPDHPAGPGPRDDRRELVRRRLVSDHPRATASTPIEPRDAQSPAELSYAQQRLWFLQQLVPDSPFYTESSALHVRAAIDPDILRATLGEIVRRHEVLRTAFREGTHEATGH